MNEGNYTKEEVGRVLGFNVKELENFINETMSIPIYKDTYTFTELVLLNKLKKFYE